MSTQSKKKKGFLSDTVFKYFIKKEEYRNWFYEIIKEKTGIDLNLYELYDNEANSGIVKKIIEWMQYSEEVSLKL